MKKIFISIVASNIVVFALILASCSNGITRRQEQIYQIDVSWELAEERQYQIVLKDVEYTNSYYKAKISGSLFRKIMNFPVSMKYKNSQSILSKNVVLSGQQKYRLKNSVKLTYMLID